MLLNTIFHGDCFDFLSSVPSNSVDAIISDPPYNTTALKWDKKIDWDKFWCETKRILRLPTSVVALFSAQPFTTDLINSNRKDFRYELIWEKSIASGFLDANKRPLRTHENILIFSEKFGGSIYNPQKFQGEPYRNKGRRGGEHYGAIKSRIATVCDDGMRFPRSVMHYKTVQKSGHPTCKPLELIENLIKTYSHENQVVLDPFMGSGTTAVACLNQGRFFIGSEQDKEYIKLIKNRIKGIKEA